MAKIQETEWARAFHADRRLRLLLDDMKNLCTAIYRVIGEEIREDEDFPVIQTLAESIQARCEQAGGELKELFEAASTALLQKPDEDKQPAEKVTAKKPPAQ